MPNLDLELRPDCSLVPTTGGNVHLRVRLRTPDMHRAKVRLPLNLGLVIDASGSMRGRPLQAAKSAAREVLERLSVDDVVSVVSFADDIQIHADSIGEEGRPGATHAIEMLHTRGCTDLAGGWLTAAGCVANEMARRGGRRNHVVLLSDGYANRGICDPSTLGRHATELRQRHLGSSCVGVGERYSTEQLYAIAEQGGGRMHHAADPQEIATVVLGELDDVRSTAAEGVTARIEPSHDVRAVVVDDCPVQDVFGTLTAELGSMLSGATRDLVVEFTLPPGKAGEKLRLSVCVRWQAPGAAPHSQEATAEATVTYVPEAEIGAEAWDAEVTESVATAWLRRLIQQALELNRRHRYDHVARLRELEGRRFEQYCARLPSGRALVEEFRRRMDQARAAWPEHQRKEAQIHYYKQGKGEIDKRDGGWGDRAAL